MKMLEKNANRLLSLMLILAVLGTSFANSAFAFDGTSTYAAVVYVDGINGSDNNDGAAPESAVKTLMTAYRQLDLLQQNNAENAEVGYIVICGDLTVSSAFTEPSHSYEVIVTAQYDAKVYDASLTLKASYVLNGPTTFENMTWVKSDSNVRAICANGNRLTLGSGLVCKPFISSKTGTEYYISILGGKYATSTANIDLNLSGDPRIIIKSGTWKHVYLTSYKGGASSTDTTYTLNSRRSVLTIEGGIIEGNIGIGLGSRLHCDDTVSIELAPSYEMDSDGVIGLKSGARIQISGQVKGNLTVQLDDQAENGVYATASASAGDNTFFFDNLPEGKEITVAAQEGRKVWSLTDSVVAPPMETNQMVIYLDGTNGSDHNTGLTAQTAVRTVNAAYLALQVPAGETGTIIVCGDTTIPSKANLPEHSYPIVITGQDATGNYNATLTFAYHATINGETTFEDLSLYAGNGKYVSYLFANGHPLTMGTGLTCTGKKYPISVAGGASSSIAGNTVLKLMSGTYHRIFGGGSATNQLDGSARITVDGTVAVNGAMTANSGDVKNTNASDNELILTKNSNLILHCNADIERLNAEQGSQITMDSGTTLSVLDILSGTIAANFEQGAAPGNYVIAPSDTASNAVEFGAMPDGTICQYAVKDDRAVWSLAVPEIQNFYVYLSDSGNNGNDGLSPLAPVATISRAISILNEHMKSYHRAVIVICGEYTATTHFNAKGASGGAAPNFAIVFTSEANGVDYSQSGAKMVITGGSIYLYSPTTFENITLYNKDIAVRYIAARGNALTMGNGVVCQPNSNGVGVNLLGGIITTSKSSKTTNITINSGNYGTVYGGNSGGGSTTHTSLVLNGGTVDALYGGSSSGEEKGDIRISINGGTVKGYVVGSVAPAGAYKGSVSIDITSGRVLHSVVPGMFDTQLTSSICIDLSEKNEFYLGGTASVDQFKGGGILSLGKNALLTIEGQLFGSTELSIDDPIQRTYVTAPEASSREDSFHYEPTGTESLAVALDGATRTWGISGAGTGTQDELVTVEITVRPASGTLTVYNSRLESNKDMLLPIRTQPITPDDGSEPYQVWTYQMTEGVKCLKLLAGSDYYSLVKQFLVSQNKVVGQRQPISVEVTRRALSGGHDASSATARQELTDELQALMTMDGVTMRDGSVYQNIISPGVSGMKDGTLAENQFTTYNQMIDLITSLDEPGDNMYIYQLGISGQKKAGKGGYDIPVVIFSTADLSSAQTLEEAAELIRSDSDRNGKVTVQYTAQIHGNEPSSGEGALAVMQALAGQYDSTLDVDTLLKNINLYIVPRVNPDGSAKFSRYDTVNAKDPNRDNLVVTFTEVQNLHRAYMLFCPEVAIDGHEFKGQIAGTVEDDYSINSDLQDDDEAGDYVLGMEDIRISSSGSLNSSAALIAGSRQMATDAIRNCQNVGLRAYEYGNTVGNVNNRAYLGLNHCYAILLESRGIKLNKSVNYERRVFAQYTAVSSILNFVVKNRDTILECAKSARAEAVTNGKTYDESDYIVLQHGISGNTYTEYTRPVFNYNGTCADSSNIVKFEYFDTALKTRPRPTAYVISAQAQGITYTAPDGIKYAALENLKRILQCNGIEYYVLERPMGIEVQGYEWLSSSANLTSSTVVTFEPGSMVIPMDQVSANVAAVSFEPDVLDNVGSTLVKEGIINIESLYRCTVNYARYALGLEVCTEHRWDDGTQIKAPTSIQSGIMQYTCNVCGETKTAEIPATGGNYDTDWRGSSYAPGYDVSVDSGKHGAVTVSPKNASQGNLVTVTIRPDISYELFELTVTDPTGKLIDFTEGENNRYVFTMPNSKVTVKALFRQVVKNIELPFTDVNKDDWFVEAVQYIYGKNLMLGTSTMTFEPNAPFTRAMVAQTLYNYDGGAQAGVREHFTDVTSDAWYADAINWAAYCGVVSGYGNGIFGPENNVTREQLATILYNYAKFKGYDTNISADLSKFSDEGFISSYATRPMQWAVGSGLVGGMGDGTLNPGGQATRAQAAAILMRFIVRNSQ